MNINKNKTVENLYDGFFQRLNEVIDEKPLSFWQQHLGSTAVIQTRWKKGKFPGSAKLIELCNIANISPTWLLLGLGDKKIPTDIKDLNASFAKEYIKRNIYKIKDIDFFLDIFLNLSLEDLKLINDIPIKNIFIESENFIQKLNLLQKALKNAVQSLNEELTGAVPKNKQKKQFILSFNKDQELTFVNDFFLEKFKLKKKDILNTKYRLPISDKDKKRIESTFSELNTAKTGIFTTRFRVVIEGHEEWQVWETTTFFEEKGSLSRKSIGRPLTPSEIRENDIQ